MWRHYNSNISTHTLELITSDDPKILTQKLSLSGRRQLSQSRAQRKASETQH